MPANDKLTELQNIKPMLGKFIAGDFIAIAGEMHRFPASNENTDQMEKKPIQLQMRLGKVICCLHCFCKYQL